ncbi:MULTISPECIES: DUF3224 domain-containing protein [Shewanella]|uniref:DUF3224 domain-containing protein n=1 Tax=Shewanella TaxID=22 RepID=UPI000C4A87E8|nr:MULTISPECIES: DUF3224 domain-containing protein [Shewanella]NCQ46988.1 DUF3224 domain-containing protein [Shewanella frigidimarina]NCO72902.1 DUF3224 domain-containing protein [Shewanella vesiculosa]NCP38606.1 DUF3224 domain-containing protein [Shewanella vesiculosa]NCP71321.1 DUF3224 domain-containing protein [Shewanella vesiculosa]NCP76258.1 DUF3224 domain-containing protein [Shewanella vesiculosa]
MTKIVLKGVFQITTWNESTYAEHHNDSKQTIAEISQTYSGDVSGSAQIRYIMSYQKEGSAVFVGIEHLTIDTPEIAGSIVLQHNGVFSQGVAQSQFNVIADSGTDNLLLYIGHGEFTSTENGQADYIITLQHE